MRTVQSSRLYIRVILIYTITAVALVLLLSSVLILRSQRFLEEQLDRVRQEQLNQLKLYLDENVFSQPRETLINGYFSFSWDYLLPRFFQNEVRDAYDLVRLHRQLKEILSANRYMHSISLLRLNDGRLISTQYGIIDFEALSPGQRAVYLPADRFLARDDRYGWSGGEDSARDPDAPQLITFFQKIPFNPGAREIGVIVVNFETAEIEAESRRLAGDSGIRIIGPGNALIADFAPRERADETRRSFRTASDASGVRYELSVPDGFILHELHAARRYLVLIAAGVLVVGVVLFDLLTSLLYTPFIRIIARITRLRGDGSSEPAASELRRADEYLDGLHGREEEHERILQANRNLNRYKMMMRIADGDFRPEDRRRVELLCGIRFLHTWFSIVIARPAGEMMAETGTAHGELLDQDLVATVEEYLVEGCGWRVLAVAPRTAHLYLLVNSARSSILPETEELRALLNTRFGIPYALQLSSPKQGLEQASAAFREAELAGRYRFYFSEAGTLVYDPRMDADGPAASGIGEDTLEKAGRYVQARDRRRLSHLIDAVVAEAVESFAAPETVRSFLLQILGTLDDLRRRVSGAPLDSPPADAACGRLKAGIMARMEALEASAEDEHLDRERRFLDAVRSYIAAEVDSRMSLESVAERFGVSAGHLGRLLRRRQRGGFKELLLQSKLNRAVELLCRTDRSVKDISADLGYSSPAYFARIFRERYGTTPAEYRRDQLCAAGSESNL